MLVGDQLGWWRNDSPTSRGGWWLRGPGGEGGEGCGLTDNGGGEPRAGMRLDLLGSRVSGSLGERGHDKLDEDGKLSKFVK